MSDIEIVVGDYWQTKSPKIDCEVTEIEEVDGITWINSYSEADNEHDSDTKENFLRDYVFLRKGKKAHKNDSAEPKHSHYRKDDSQNIAASILQDALAAMSERGQSYDTTGDGKERSMAKVVQMFNTLTGANLTTEQGWDFMILLKLVRASQGYKHDNYIDGSAYFSLAGEAASEAVDD